MSALAKSTKAQSPISDARAVIGSIQKRVKRDIEITTLRSALFVVGMLVLLSALTYEWTHVTLTSALPPMIRAHALGPS
jgi:hypothetical protein